MAIAVCGLMGRTDLNQYRDAQAIAKHSGEVAGIDHVEVAMIFNNLGDLHRVQRRFAEAAPPQTIDLDQRARWGSQQLPDRVTSEHSSYCVRHARKPAQAVPLFVRGIAIIEKCKKV